ncbi:MAG TPA: L-histidine N(alpha)-methyltransferase [Polyangia bacterium]|nr:L-histidine N(alpha)-methyltransferase [Polyangia bacterium]
MTGPGVDREAAARRGAGWSDGAVARAVREGLLASPKRLPPWLLYDDAGSALFDEITRLPEYYLTRTEHAILDENADAIVGAARPPGAAAGPSLSLSLVELGAGSARKTRHVIEAALRAQERVLYVPVDVSPAALAAAERHLADVEGLTFCPVVARYPDELGWLSAVPGRRLVMFLGSNIGNYEPPEAAALLRAVSDVLRPGDSVLVGADLRKDPAIILPAYDDAAGVSERFNLNLLERINRELGGAFDARLFRHVARWNDAASRVELSLESRARQAVPIRGLDLTARFEAGELMHMENSYKLTVPRLEALFRAARLEPARTFTDARGWFAVQLGHRR